MTQKFSPGIGASNIPVATNLPTANTYPIISKPSNRMQDCIEEIAFETITTTSGDNLMSFVARENGNIIAVRLVNGSVACDGSNGLELDWLNKTNSDDSIAYVGFGSGTEAVKATDTDAAVAAYEAADVAVTDTGRFNKGDVIHCTIDRDGTTVVGTIIVVVSYEAQGR